MAGYGLEIWRNGGKWLLIAKHGCKWLNMAWKGWNGWICPSMAVNDCKWL